MTRVLVTGGRDYTDEAALFAALDALAQRHAITCIIHGACVDKRTGKLCGADKIAEDWAISREIPYCGMPARWTPEGRAAGPLRNDRMIKLWRPEVVVAAPGGDGTASCVGIARAAGIEVIEVQP